MKKILFLMVGLGSAVGGLGAMALESGAVNRDKPLSPVARIAQQINTDAQAKATYFGPQLIYKLLLAAIAAKAGYRVMCDIRKIDYFFDDPNYLPVCTDSAELLTAVLAFFVTPAWQSLYSHGASIARVTPSLARLIIAEEQACARLQPELLRGMSEELGELIDQDLRGVL